MRSRSLDFGAHDLGLDEGADVADVVADDSDRAVLGVPGRALLGPAEIPVHGVRRELGEVVLGGERSRAAETARRRG